MAAESARYSIERLQLAPHPEGAGCTVAPGFDYADFELADGAALLREFPDQAALITRLT